MADKKTPGQPIRFSATSWNQMADAANFYTKNRQLGSGPPVNPLHWDRTIIRLRNDTGARRRRGDWLAVGDLIANSATLNQNLYSPSALVFSGDQATTRDDTMAVLLNYVADGDIGLAQISGVGWGLVDINEEDHPYATAKPSSNTLYNIETCERPGPIRMLWHVTGTGQKNACFVITQESSRITSRFGNTGSTYTLTTSDQDVAFTAKTGDFAPNDNNKITSGAIDIVRKKRWYRVAVSAKATVTLTRNTGVAWELRLQLNTGSGYADAMTIQDGLTIVDAALPTGHSTIVRHMSRTEVLQLDVGDLLKLVAKKTNYNGGMTVTITDPIVVLTDA